jgi:hypothetical protein
MFVAALTTRQSAGLAVLTGIFGLLGGLVVSIYQTRARRQETSLSMAQQHRREFIAVTSALRNTLSDLVPSRLALNASETTLQSLRERHQVWLTRRDEIAVAGEMHPDDGLRHAAARLVVHVNNTFTSGMWLVRDLVQHTGDSQMSLAAARHDHAAAMALLEATLDAARTSSAGLEERIAQIEAERDDAEEEFTLNS